MKYFNLLDEAWIPVRTKHGDIIEISITDALINAKNYSELADSSPANLIALYRILLAIVHRAMTLENGVWGMNEQAKWFKNGFPEIYIKNYLEKFRERFWFFHPEYPFMQVRSLGDSEEIRGKTKPWTQLALDKACGDSPLVFDHSLDDLPKSIPIKMALRNHLGTLQFIPGGLVKILRISDKAGPLANTAAIIPLGSDLAETLSLALHKWKSEEINDLPSWESEPPKIIDLMGKPKMVTGPNDRYTRLTRAVLWLPEKEVGYVKKLLFSEGLSIEEDESSPDPMASYRESKDGKKIRITFQEGRAIWRDLSSLLPSAKGEFSIPPATADNAKSLYEEMEEENQYGVILAAGVTSDQAKILRWRAEKIQLPKKIYSTNNSLDEQLNLSESTYKQLKGICSEMIAQTMPDPTHKDTKEKARSIQSSGPGMTVFFSTLEKGLPRLLENIANGNEKKACKEWIELLEIAIKKSWNQSCKIIGQSHLSLKAQANAFYKINGLIKKNKNLVGE